MAQMQLVGDNGRGWYVNSSGNLVPTDSSCAVQVDVGSITTTGDLALAGALDVTGNTTVGGTCGITGNTTVGGTLGVTGNTTLSGTCGVTGNATVGGTLGVTGNTTLSGTLALTGTATLAAGLLTASYIAKTANGGGLKLVFAEEELTLNTGGTTTDTTANLLPANSFIIAVTARLTQAIATATEWKLGDASTADRFTSAYATVTLATLDYAVNCFDPSKAAGYSAYQASAAKVRVTTTGTPSAGKVRICVVALQQVAPTA